MRSYSSIKVWCKKKREKERERCIGKKYILWEEKDTLGNEKINYSETTFKSYIYKVVIYFEKKKSNSNFLLKSMSLTKFIKKIASIIYDTKQLQLDIILIMNHIFIIYLFRVIPDVNNVF